MSLILCFAFFNKFLLFRKILFSSVKKQRIIPKIYFQDFKSNNLYNLIKDHEDKFN